MTIHICSPAIQSASIQKKLCPDCKKESARIIFCYEWYGPDATCLRCGRRWSDYEWMPLQFERGIRKKNIKNAIKRYREYSQKGSDVVD